MECFVCKRDFRLQECEVVELTDEERQAIGSSAPTKQIYCKPCWRALKDPEQGPQLLKGLFLLRAKQLGVRDADEKAEAYYKLLVKGTKSPPSGKP